jgi:hypothetical protein
MFDLSNITLAFASAASAESAFDAMTADMLIWHAAGEYPSNADVINAIKEGLPHLSAASVKVYASKVLLWAKSGKTPKTIGVMVKTSPDGHKSTRGRPAGQGKGKSTATPAADAAPAEESTPTVVNDDRAWKLFIEDMRAKVPARKDWAAADITAFQECTMQLLTIIKRNAK